jgi:Flp pilus assembly protein TadG
MGEILNSPKVVAVVFVVVLTVDGFLFYRQQQALNSAGDAAATTAPVEERASSPEEEGVRVFVSAPDGVEGFSASEDGRLVYDQVSASGTEEFEAEEAIIITADDGGAVQVGVDGENLEPLGASGEPTTRTFTAESES